MKRCLKGLGLGIALVMVSASPAFAQEIPVDEQAWIWNGAFMLTIVITFTVAVGFFFVAVKWGLVRRMEEAKYYMLTIDEPDYYSPEGAKEEDDAVAADPAANNASSNK